MAYNTKYILKYCNSAGNNLRIELQLWGYIGEQYLIVNDGHVLDEEGRFVVVNKDGEYVYDRDANGIEGGANPFSLTFHNDTGEKGGAIRALEANMEFYEDILFNIDDLATSDETEIRAVFYYDNNIEFIGFVTPDFFNVEITENPLIRLTASDRIGVLKDIDYPIESEILYKVSVLNIVSKILKETGLDININVVCNMYCEQFQQFQGQGDILPHEMNNPFQDVWVNEYRAATDLDTMETLDCYTILQRIMNQFNCLLTQRNGEWWIVNKRDLESGRAVRMAYDSDGTLIKTDRLSFDEITFSLIDTGGERTLVPAGAKNTYILEFGKEMIYPFNFNLKSTSSAINSANYWTERTFIVNADFKSLIANAYNPNGSVLETYNNYDRVLENREEVITGLAGDTTNFTPMPLTIEGDKWILQSEKFNVVTFDKKSTSFKVKINGAGKPYTGMLIGLFMEIKDNLNNVSYFSLRPKITGDYSIATEYEFYQPTSIFNSTKIYLLPLYFENKYNSSTISVEKNLEFEMNIAKGQHQSYDITTAKFFVRIYPNTAYKKGGGNPYNQDLTEVTNYLKSVSVEFLNDSQVPTGTVYQTKLNGKFTKPTEERKVLFGDMPYYGQNGIFYKGREDSLSIQYNFYTDKLRDWFTPYDSERNPQLIHSLRQLTYSYGKAHDELKIGFDIPKIDPLAHFAVRCVSDKKVLVNPEYDELTESHNKYITASIGKYLNDKRFVFVEGTIDYLRSHFEGKLAQIRTDEIQHQEFIYSYFEQEDIS